jgi:hypothetical protein
MRVFLLLLGGLLSQAPQVSSITGTVIGADTGSPLTDATVRVSPGGAETKTDSQGRYELHGLSPGNQTVSASVPIEGRARVLANRRQVSLTAGIALSGVDFRIPTFGQISGRVLDENKEPVPGVTVMLIAREYSHGALRYIYTRATVTDDQGGYTLGRIPAGRAWLLMAQSRAGRLPSIADAPADPKLRRKVASDTWYPNSRDAAGAQQLTLRFGEHREAVDFQLIRVPSFCVEGKIERDGSALPMSFILADASPSGGEVGGSSMFTNPPNGLAAADGRFRICELPRGNYVLSANPATNSPAFFGSVPFTITDHDVKGLKLTPGPRVSMAGEVVFEGPEPEKPVEGKLSLSLLPLTRPPYASESGLHVQADIPRSFSFDGLFINEYGFDSVALPGSLYIKSMTYGTQSILYKPLRVGSAMGDAGIRIVMGTDGGQISAKVTDKNGNAIGDSWVHILPDQVVSEAMLAAVFVSGQTDQNGAWTSKSLAPGKYYVLATTGPVDKSPEDINRLWQARVRAQEVTVTKSPAVAVKIIILPE